MSKFLRIDTSEMSYLKRKAIPDMIFSSPNDVLRYILELPPKRESEQLKIRVDDVVLEQLKARAEQLNVEIRPLDKLLEKILKQNEVEDKAPIPPRRRPPTR